MCHSLTYLLHCILYNLLSFASLFKFWTLIKMSATSVNGYNLLNVCQGQLSLVLWHLDPVWEEEAPRMSEMYFLNLMA